MNMPRLIRAVGQSLTSSRTGNPARLARARSMNSAGSPTLRRTMSETKAGTTPTANMPRQPMSGSSSGVTTAAISTPACQPSPT
jgi:hypothetical protein